MKVSFNYNYFETQVPKERAKGAENVAVLTLMLVSPMKTRFYLC